jgi:hypothetical protein
MKRFVPASRSVSAVGLRISAAAAAIAAFDILSGIKRKSTRRVWSRIYEKWDGERIKHARARIKREWSTMKCLCVFISGVEVRSKGTYTESMWMKQDAPCDDADVPACASCLCCYEHFYFTCVIN